MPKPTSSRPTTPETEDLKRMRKLAWILDESIRLPGGFRIGVDGLLGLIPGVGDFSAAAIGSYIIYEARRLGAPRSVLIRMATNLGLETLIGTIPLIGDLFDFYFKANTRNIRLLRDFQEAPKPTQRKSRFRAAGLVSVMLLGMLVILAIPVLIFVALIQAVF